MTMHQSVHINVSHKHMTCWIGSIAYMGINDEVNRCKDFNLLDDRYEVMNVGMVVVVKWGLSAVIEEFRSLKLRH